MIHALDQNRPAAVIDYGHNAGPVIARRLRLGACDYLSRDLQGENLLRIYIPTGPSSRGRTEPASIS
jgi:hypothetical protein